MTNDEKPGLFDGQWHIDKRISVGHIITTLTVTGTIMLWMLQLESRVKVAEVRLDQMEMTQTQNRVDRNTQYTEIIRRLERLDQKIDGK